MLMLFRILYCLGTVLFTVVAWYGGLFLDSRWDTTSLQIILPILAIGLAILWVLVGFCHAGKHTPDEETSNVPSRFRFRTK